MIPEYLTQKQITAVYAIAADLFAHMCNSKYRGEKFMWVDFPQMVRSHVEANMFLQGKISKKSEKEAGDMAAYIAKNWIKDAGFVENT